MKSNVELYQGRESASYEATLDALEAAGAEGGARVDVVAYSQGGMIAAHLAMESPYEVTMQLTAEARRSRRSATTRRSFSSGTPTMSSPRSREVGRRRARGQVTASPRRGSAIRERASKT
ncbi:hypothetical protein [Microbacterium sp. Se63.02b]|uniref:hypothetical protein n=1 Tax=Microbacterium sp. Se63.02b TaxID=2709304 RepID=UPI0016054751|nr:hypothetical protein [Microbacterium sp. Se63.02b]QNA93924.1 hypothetical protein G4G29_19585 [Microbacterium sp. Se63.02b]